MADVIKIRWWQWIPHRFWRVVAVVEAADDVPIRLPRKAIVLVGSRERPKWLAFDCPCRLGHRIMLTVDPAHSPRWALIGDRKVTVKPSVDFRGGSHRCHFMIENGRVIWVPNKGWM